MLQTFFARLSTRIRVTAAITLLVALALGAVTPLVANGDDPSFDPTGGVFATLERAGTVLQSDSRVAHATFLVESPTGDDVLTAEALGEWQLAAERAMRDPVLADHYVARFDPDLGADVPGVASIATVIDGSIPGGLATASTEQVKTALGDLLADGAPTAGFRFTLSEQATVSPGPTGEPVWASPAFTATVTYDESSFASTVDAEQWLRAIQTELRQNATLIDPIGVGIDIESSFDEAVQAAAPFIFLAVALIVLSVAVLHRSYWSAAVVATGLGVTMLTYNGIAALIGLKMGSLLLSFIVPIAMISFGVDFYIHGVGRTREVETDTGRSGTDAYPAAMAAVFSAMLLAAATSVAAFMSNALSGIEAIVQFGIGASIALLTAWIVLGHLAPRVLVGIEATVGPNAVKGISRHAYRLALVPVAVVAGLGVTLASVMPPAGAGAVSVFVGVFVAVPAWLTRRRNRRHAAQGRILEKPDHGAARGLAPIGTLVAALARRRVVTLAVATVIGTGAVVAASSVDSGFELKDFLAANTDFVQSIERISEHLPAAAGGEGFIYIEGDLTDPAALRAIDDTVAGLRATAAPLGRNADGELLVGPTATDLARLAATTAELPDADRDGLPDTRAGVAALYERIRTEGVGTPESQLAYAATEVPTIWAQTDDGTMATAIRVQVGSFTDGDIVLGAREALEAAAATLALRAPGLETVAVSGNTIAQFESLESFSRSMVVSLPIAVVLTFLIALGVLRSARFALAAVIPIGFVVSGVYAFMHLFGFQLNVVTATIAAISVGVGIDFSTHFVARYREEFASTGQPLAAVRQAGAGTGGALALSALTSVVGFTVMAFAPTPIFSTYGILTVVMVGLALAAALLVLPSLVVTLTPRADTIDQPAAAPLEPAA